MADIKTRDTVKGTIKTLDKATVAGQKMKEAYIATKEKAERSVNARQKNMLPTKCNPVLMKSPTMLFMPLIKPVEKESEKPNGIFNPPKTAFSVLSSSEPNSH